MDKIFLIKAFLKRSGWIAGEVVVEYLAAGEYNENFLITNSSDEKTVFRINHGSQLGLKNQIEYEYNVLKAIELSGVTPRARFYDSNAKGLEAGVLLMDFLPGVPLEYAKDKYVAAEIFSNIHRLPPSPKLIIQENPIMDIADESFSLIHRYRDHPLRKEKKRLEDYHEKISMLGQDKGPVFKNEPICMVNTEVNSHNFLITGDTGYLVDWEKAVISHRYQDLGHFLVPTTTLWKSNYVYLKEEKRSFLSRYRDCMKLDLSLDELVEKTTLLEKTILLRGLSWCFMAYYEYTRTERALTNKATFEKIKDYLNKIDWFLN